MAASPGDLLAVESGIIVHGCNAQGVMGSGVALAIRQKYPGAFEAYHAAHKARGLHLGDVVWFKVSSSPALAIANAITQENFGRDPQVRYVDYEAIRTSMDAIAVIAKRHSLAVHYPRIGAGLGNGDWPTIASIIDQSLQGVEHHLWVPPKEWNPDWDGAFPSPARTPSPTP